jgi:hypothetical protein
MALLLSHDKVLDKGQGRAWPPDPAPPSAPLRLRL